MRRVVIPFALCAVAVAVLAAPPAGRWVALDVNNQDTAFALTLTRGEALLVRADLDARGTSYTNNDVTGYLWVAATAASTGGTRFTSTTNLPGSVWFSVSSAGSLALTAGTYFAEVVLTNASYKYDWKQGALTVKEGAGITQ